MQSPFIAVFRCYTQPCITPCFMCRPPAAQLQESSSCL